MLAAWAMAVVLAQVPTSDAREYGPVRVETESGLAFPGLYLPDFEYSNTRRWVTRYSLRLNYPRLRLLSLDAVTVAPAMHAFPPARQLPNSVPVPGAPTAWLGARVATPNGRLSISAGRVFSLATGALRVAGAPKLLMTGRF